VYDGLEPHNHYEPQQDTNNPIPTNILTELHSEKIHKIGKNIILSATINVVTTVLGKSVGKSF
jgi:hypothetical protein